MRESLAGAALAVVTGEAGQRLMGELPPMLRRPPHTPGRSPQPARSGCSGPREGWAVGPSRRDAQRPSGDQGSRHADRGGKRITDSARVPKDELGMSVLSLSARQRIASAPSPETCRQSPSSPQDAQRGPSSTDVHQYKRAGQPQHPSVVVGHQSREASSRCTRLCGSAVNRRHWRARAGPASRQLLAHEAMPRACPGSGLSPVVQNAARAAAEGADPA
jgi:hypothetical protein